jgi:hypothetical protein
MSTLTRRQLALLAPGPFLLSLVTRGSAATPPPAAMEAIPSRIVLTWAGDPATIQAVTWRTEIPAPSTRAPVVNAYPAGTIAIDSVTDQVTNVATDTVREDTGIFRLDYRFNHRNTAYARYNVDNAYLDICLFRNMAVQFQFLCRPGDASTVCRQTGRLGATIVSSLSHARIESAAAH